MADTVFTALMVTALVMGAVGSAGAIYNFQDDTVPTHSHPVLPQAEPFDDADILTSLNQIYDYHADLNDLLIDLRTDVAILKARGDVTTLPSTPTTPLNAIDLNLYTQDNKGSIKSIFSRDTPVILFTGKSEFDKRDFAITIRAPSGSFVKDKIATTFSNGDISEAWIIPNNAEIGVYTVKITISGKTDTIEFQLT